jgi:hypothetical protein
MTLEARLSQLRELFDEHGQALPTSDSHPDASLVRWAARQRALRRQGVLAQNVIDELDAVQFVWDPLEAAWETRYTELEAYYDEHGHSNVPTGWEAAPKLASWVARQRRLQRQGSLAQRRREALAALDFEFDPQAARWEGRLAQYAAANLAEAGGGPRVTESLVRWAARQRRSHAQGKLAAERVEALHQLEGWTWTSPSALRPSALRRLGLRLAREAADSRSEGGGGGGGAASCYRACGSVGRALLISVGAKREKGAATELADAREALRTLGYSVTTVENPTASELTASVIAHTSLEGWEEHGSSVVGVMAHGFGSQLECQDGGWISLQQLFGLLEPSSAPALRGKPKIILVQACRRGEPPMVASRSSTAHAGATEDADDGRLSSPFPDAPPAVSAEASEALGELHDFMWAFATTPGTVAYRGALFAAFREVVEEHGCETPWHTLLTLTN